MTIEKAMTIEEIVEEFLARHRLGESPTVEYYATRFPDLADEIRATLPALAIVERHKANSVSVSDAADTVAHPAPTQISDYRIVGEIGRGGMGIVYEAEQESLGRRVALKLLPVHIADNENAIARFKREARAAAKMHHSNIVPVFEIGEDQGRVFYAMQRIDGCGLDEVIEAIRGVRSASDSTLDDDLSVPVHEAEGSFVGGIDRVAMSRDLASAVLRDGFAPQPLLDGSSVSDRRTGPAGDDSGRTPPTVGAEATLVEPGSHHGDSLALSSQRGRFRSIARIGRQAARALAYAHSRGIVHRDIKPSNLILDAAGVVWVSDFGLAKAEEEGLTQTGDFLGTVRYMSPERFHGECDFRADIYGLGITLFELLALRPAFASADRLRMIERIANSEVTPLRAIDPKIPADLETIVNKAVDSDPRRRYESASEMADDLQRFIEDRAIKARRTSLAERWLRWSRRNKSLAAAISLTTALLVFVAIAAPLAFFREATLRNQAEDARRLAELRGDEIHRNLYYAHMNLAGQAAQEPGGVGWVREIIANWRTAEASDAASLLEDPRGWEWYYLNALCHRERLILDGPTNTVWSVDWSPDGKRVVAGANDGSLTVWDTKTGNIIHRKTTRADSCVDWSPDGTRIVSTTFEGEVVLWDADRLTEIQRLGKRSDTSFIRFVRWSPDGRRLAWFEGDGKVAVWDVAAGSQIIELALQSSIASLEWNHDGSRIATVCGGLLEVWDAADGQRVWEVFDHTQSLKTVSWSPDSQRLAMGGHAGVILIRNAADGAVISRCSAGSGAVWSVCWGRDPNRLASGHGDRTVRVWDVATARPVQTLRGHTDQILTVVWSADGRQLASAGKDLSVRLWDVNVASQTSTLHGHTRNITAVDWKPDGTRLATASADGTAKLWDLSSGEATHTLAGQADVNTHENYVLDVGWSPDGYKVAFARHDGTVRICSSATGEELRVINAHGMRIWAMHWSPDSSRLASASADGKVRIWNTDTGEQLSDFNGHRGAVHAVRWSPDGTKLASAAFHPDYGDVQVWQAASGEVLWKIQGNDRLVRRLRWKPDGTQLATGSDGMIVKRWEMATGKEIGEAFQHTGPVTSIAWSPDAIHPRLAASSSNGTVRIWDLATGELSLTLRTPAGPTSCVRWSFDGTRLAAGGGDTLYIWDATAGYREK